MVYFGLILASVFGLAITVFYFRKNLKSIALKNAKEKSTLKKILNYPLTVIWYSYLIVFFIGLTVNNLIFK